jgi:hypothetical protein
MSAQIAVGLVSILEVGLATAVVAITQALGHRARRMAAHRGVVPRAAAGAFFGLGNIAVKAITGLVERGSARLGVAPWLTIALTGGIAAEILAVGGPREGQAVGVIALTGVTAAGPHSSPAAPDPGHPNRRRAVRT